MDWFQDFILERLHHHTFSNMFSDKISRTHCAWILSCSSFEVDSWPNLLIIFPIFHNILNATWITTSFNYMYPSMHVHTSHQCYKCPPFTLHPWQWMHNVVCDNFATITSNANFHVGWKQLHTLPWTMFHSFCWWVDIMFTKDEIFTLADVVIVDPRRVDLCHGSCST
jgi:hypothetical protein